MDAVMKYNSDKHGYRKHPGFYDLSEICKVHAIFVVIQNIMQR